MSKPQEVSEKNPPEVRISTSRWASHGPKPTHLTFYLIFFIMEAAFAALSWYCYIHPRSLPSAFNFMDDTSTVRSGFISVFSSWQSLAVSLAIHICANVMSGKNAARDESGTGGWFFMIIQVALGVIEPGKPVKIALLARALLAILRIVGNATITVSGGREFERALTIGGITTFSLTSNTTDITSQAYFDRRLESDMIVRLEQLYKAPWGFIPPPNFLVPLPAEALTNSSDRVVYNSDVVSFRHDCQWQAPDSYSGDTITIGNSAWTAPEIGSNGSIIIPETGTVPKSGSSIVFLIPKDTEKFTGNSVYLFLGANSTIPPTFNDSETTNISWIDLSTLPTMYNPDGFTSHLPSPRALRAPLATLLVCNPRLEFFPRRVHFQPVKNRTQPDLSLQFATKVSSPGNIQPLAARELFTVLLNTTIMSPDEILNHVVGGSMRINWVSGTMLLDGIKDKTRVSFPPFDRETINNKVDTYTLSALKAFTSGYQGPEPDLSSQGGLFTETVGGKFRHRGLALRSSLPFAVLHTSLFIVQGIVVSVMVYSTWVTRPGDRARASSSH